MHVEPNLAEWLENYPSWITEWVFLIGKAEMLSNVSSKISNSLSSLFLGKKKDNLRITNWPILSA